jgi:hypothetical protein
MKAYKFMIGCRCGRRFDKLYELGVIKSISVDHEWVEIESKNDTGWSVVEGLELIFKDTKP